MATQPKRSETKPLEGEALARAMAANPELVAASNEAKRRADAGEPGVRWADVKRRLAAS